MVCARFGGHRNQRIKDILPSKSTLAQHDITSILYNSSIRKSISRVYLLSTGNQSQGPWVWWILGPLSEHEHGSSQGNHHRKTDTSSYASGTSLFDCNVILTQLRVVDTSANRRDAPTSRQKGNMKPLVLSFVITLVPSREKLRAIRRKLDRRHCEHFVGSVAC